MLFYVVLLSGLSFAFIAQAVPFGLTPQFTRRQESKTRGSVNLDRPDLTFVSVSATIRIPSLTGNVGESVTIWIETDSDGCKYGHLLLGINATIGQDGTMYSAMYTDNISRNWKPMPMPMDISVGDLIHMAISVDQNHITSASGTIENFTNNQAAAEVNFTRAYDFENDQLCGHTPGWFAETGYPDLIVTVEFLNAGANSVSAGMIYPTDSLSGAIQHGPVKFEGGNSIEMDLDYP